MPYIKPKDRKYIDNKVGALKLISAGELNYTFTKIILDYLKTVEAISGSVRYQDLNDIVGALEGAKLEFYRRYISGYENQKIEENGDVYDKEAKYGPERND